MTSPAEDRNAMPTEMKINLVVHYDKEFWEMFRGGSLNQLRRIINMAKILFSYPQLNTYIDIVVKKEYYISSPINPTEDLQKLVEFTADNHPDYADVYLYMSVLDQGDHNLSCHIKAELIWPFSRVSIRGDKLSTHAYFWPFMIALPPCTP